MTRTFAKADHGTAMTNETTHAPAPLPLQGMRVIIDAQVHLNHLGIEACLGAMDAVGIDGAIIDQYPLTGTRLENGAYRYSYAMSDEAVLRYPARFSYVARIDNRDPDRDPADRRSAIPSRMPRASRRSAVAGRDGRRGIQRLFSRGDGI